jgi:hypothetical protein
MFNLIRHKSAFKPATVAILGLGASLALADAALASDSPYFGRWTFNGAKDQKFSAKGMAYKTIDVAPCGDNFCGVSVAADGTCGPTLFRFLGEHAKNDTLNGHGAWGEDKKFIAIQSYVDDKQKTNIHIDLGDTADVGSREGSEPKFYADYYVTGKATCTATW